MPIYKRCSRCGLRISSGTKCDCLKERHKEYDKYSRDKKSDAFYHSKEWELARITVRTLDKGIDVYIYITSSEVIFADMVHHIEPLKDNWDKRCDVDNLISLSTGTHSMIEKMYENDKSGTMKMLFEVIKRYRNYN
jgi:hypothetical protein